MSIRKGTQVEWKWGDGTAEGEVVEVFHEDVERTFDGTTVKREASAAKPAYLIEQDDGTQVLKSRSEVERAS